MRSAHPRYKIRQPGGDDTSADTPLLRIPKTDSQSKTTERLSRNPPFGVFSADAKHATSRRQRRGYLSVVISNKVAYLSAEETPDLTQNLETL